MPKWECKLVFLLSGLYRNLNAIPEILMYFVLITQAKMKLMTPDIIYIQIYIGIGILTANNFCGWLIGAIEAHFKYLKSKIFNLGCNFRRRRTLWKSYASFYMNHFIPLIMQEQRIYNQWYPLYFNKLVVLFNIFSNSILFKCAFSGW